MPDPVAAAQALAPRLRALAAEGEALRRLPDEMVALLREARLFDIFLPRDYGGLELPIAEALAVIEAVAAADAAAGWSLLKVSSSNQLAAYLDPAVARGIWGSEGAGTGAVAAGSLAPKGRAVRRDGGWRLTGRWDWGTASHFADWLLAGAMLFEADGTRVMGPRGPLARVFLIPRGHARFDDNWRTYGMRGTGSQDFAADDVFVPEGHDFDLVALRPQVGGDLYRVPYGAQMMLPHAPLALGIASAAIADLMALARDKTPLASSTLLKDKPWVQDLIGRATAEVTAARAYLHHACDRAWATETFTPELGLHLSLAATHATHAAVTAVDRMVQAAGGSAVHDTSPLQRQFRDIHVAASHFLVNVEKFAGAGKVLLGDSMSPIAG
ncbi:hypothetical protein IP88_04840 [alpha proteobacterium AAP81b]|nr:hypothetical protein IP88_04840 [alpha proteobacterium AAP81b]